MAWHMACGVGYIFYGVVSQDERQRAQRGFKLINLHLTDASEGDNSKCISGPLMSFANSIYPEFKWNSYNRRPGTLCTRSLLLRFYYQFLWFMHSLPYVPAPKSPQYHPNAPIPYPPEHQEPRFFVCHGLRTANWLRHCDSGMLIKR